MDGGSLRAAIAELEAFNAKEFALIREMDADLARYKAAVEAVLAIVGPRDIVRKAIDKALGEQKP
jgi:hypothetical protein